MTILLIILYFIGVFTPILIFFQLSTGNKGPSIGYVEIKGAPGEPVTFTDIV